MNVLTLKVQQLISKGKWLFSYQYLITSVLNANSVRLKPFEVNVWLFKAHNYHSGSLHWSKTNICWGYC